MRRPFALTLVLVALTVAGTAVAYPPRETHATANGVRLDGEARTSSSGVSRIPTFVLRNLEAQQHVVELVALTSLDSGSAAHRALTPTVPTHIVLAPHATRTLAVDYRGDPINAGGGLTYYRFELRVTVDGQPLAAISSNAYVCHIPVRQDAP